MFDKKNTMILTIVAVATLLVAVIGASFAYFSLSVGGTASTTANVTTANPGNITIDGAQKTISLHVTAADMSLAKAGKTYYATESGSVSETDTPITIATATLTGGDANASYTCDYTIEVKSTTQLTNVKNGDIFIKFAGDGISTNGTIDLSTLAQTGGTGDYKKSIDGKFTLEGTTANKDLKASLYIVNKTGDATNNQNYLAGQTISVTITVTGKTCQINSKTP